MTSAASTLTHTSPRTAVRRSEAPERAVGMYQVLAGLQVADVATTWFLLANFTHLNEGNPVVATMIDHSGLQVAMLALLVVKLAIVYVLYEKQTGIRLMSAIYGLVIFNNVLVMIWALFGR